VRRLREELGITGLFPAFADRVEYRADVGSGLTEHEVVDIFLAEVTPAMTLVPNPDEVADVAWVDLYDLSAATVRNPGKYTPWLRIYMAEHMGRIFGAAVR
jgi:isopentenyl-diphosphate Delta-isomerase